MMTLNIIESILTRNPCYKAGRKLTDKKKLMLHSVGCSQPSAKVFVTNWNKESYNRACVHAFIDANTGDIYQTLPWTWRAWHCGGSGNNTHIGVEMCEPDCIKYTGGSTFIMTDKAKALKQIQTTYKAAVELFAFLCKKYSIDPMSGIVSHKEGYAQGIATNHGDPEHLWTQSGSGYTMNGFRKDVKALMALDNGTTSTPTPSTSNGTLYRVRKTWSDTASQKGAFRDLQNAKDCADKNPDYEVYDENGNVVYAGKTSTTTPVSSFKVEVTVSNLNIRKGPGTGYGLTGKYTGKGIFTITKTSTGAGSNSGWGYLKSGAGWISLDYAKRV